MNTTNMRDFEDAQADEKESGLEQKLGECQEKLRIYLYRCCRDTHVIDDLLQKVNLFVWEKREQWDSKTPLLKWAYRIAYFTAKSHFRDKGREKYILSEEALDLAVAQEEQDETEMERKRNLRFCLEKLTGRDRELMKERYEESKSVSELADKEGKSADAMAQKLRRIRIKLSNCLSFSS